MPYFTVSGLIHFFSVIVCSTSMYWLYISACVWSAYFIFITLCLFILFSPSAKASCVFLCVSGVWKLTLKTPSRDHINFFSNLCILISVFNRILAMYGGKYVKLQCCPAHYDLHGTEVDNSVQGVEEKYWGAIPFFQFQHERFCYFIIPTPLQTSSFHYSTGKLPLFLCYNSSLTHKIIKVDLQRLGKII